MRLRLPASEMARLKDALADAKHREIGGQLFGEQIRASDFRATDVAIQRRRGTFAQFIVDVVEAVQSAAAFFRRTEHRYSQFNYIGEWHSHPSFAVAPSTTDIETMRQLVTDAEFAGNFAVLLIVRLDADTVAAGAWLFDRHGQVGPVEIEIEP